MLKRTVKDIDLVGRRVLLRVDFNVPMNLDGTIADDTRIRACLPTIRYLIVNRARVIICSHLGRPQGKVVEELRMAPIATRLSELLGKPVEALRGCIGHEVEAAVSRLADGEVMVLENLRFHAGEEANDSEFARALSRLADVYVNDAFGASHRCHASVVGVARYLPAVSGFLMEKELTALCGILENPERPFAAIVGGAKVAGKLGVLENIIPRVDALLVGGGMSATFMKSKGYAVGASTVGEDKLDYVRDVMDKAESLGVRVLLPRDLIVAEKLEAGSRSRTVPMTQVPDGYLIADIGPDAVEEFSRELKKCKTVFWNGPMGVFEIPDFSHGTRRLAEILAGLDATTVVGGGSTAEAVVEMGLAEKMSHVSTGGGASLELLQGEVLPGVAVLQDR